SSIRLYFLFSFLSLSDPRPLHSFPTRRSSDLAIFTLVPQYGEAGPLERRADLVLPAVDDAAGDKHAAVGHEAAHMGRQGDNHIGDRKSTRLNSSHVSISYAVFCLKKKNKTVMT